MTFHSKDVCTCPQCGQQVSAASDIVHVTQYRTLWGEWVRWTRCKLCHKTSRQVYSYAEHRFGAVQPIEHHVK